MGSSLRLSGDPAKAAQSLLGAVITHMTAEGVVSVRLTEVEAYAGNGEDPASHAHRGMTTRNEVMFGPAGVSYVYFVYGMHWCLNVVTGPAGRASAVLLRAGEVIEGRDLARSRRDSSDQDLARGPARLAQALGVTKAQHGLNLLSPLSPLRLQPASVQPEIVAGPRVGVSLAADTEWRFWIPRDPTVSPYRRGKLA